MTPDKSPSDILVILPNNLGDVIMATPVLEGLKLRDPDCTITFLVEEGFDAALIDSALCDEIIRLPRKTVRDRLLTGRWKEGVDELGRLVEWLRKRAFDSVINLSQYAYIAYLVTMSGIADVKGMRFLREGNQAIDDPWSQYLYAIPFNRRCNRMHVVDIYRRIAGVTRHRGGYTVALSDSEREAARSLIASLGAPVDGPRIAVFQPGAAYPAKKWPAGHYVSLGRMLKQLGWHIVVSGAPAEAAEAEAIAAETGGCTVTAGKTTFRQAMAVVSLARLCVTPDTALMHAAAALDVPVCALFGATSPVETGPWGNGHWVFSSHCTDRPCFCVTCKSMLCMKSILPETVHACITDGHPGTNPRCDVYRTGLSPDGDYSLVPVSSDAFSYVDPAGAAITPRFIDAARPLPVDLDERSFEACRSESLRFLEMTGRMCGELRSFTRDGRVEHIRAFESMKEAFASLSGIGAFWCALLNLNLNSVPILDIKKGIRATLDRCIAMDRSIRQAAGL